MRIKLNLAICLLATGTLAGMTTPALAQETERSAPRNYSVSETPVGTLLDDPEAAAILERLIPVVYANEMFQTMGRDQTLQGIQQYEPAHLTDEKLAEIQAALEELDKRG